MSFSAGEIIAWLAGIGSLLAIVVGLYKSIIHDQRKLGAQRVKEELAKQDVENAHKAGEIIAEDISPSDVVKRLRKHDF